MTPCLVPLHLNKMPDGPQKEMTRALHAATMLTLNPAGFRAAPKHRTLLNGQLTYVEQCAVDAGLTTREECLKPVEDAVRRKHGRPTPTLNRLDRGTRRNIMFGRKAVGNTSPTERRQRLAEASTAIGLELMGKAERGLAARKMASEADAV